MKIYMLIVVLLMSIGSFYANASARVPNAITVGVPWTGTAEDGKEVRKAMDAAYGFWGYEDGIAVTALFTNGKLQKFRLTKFLTTGALALSPAVDAPCPGKSQNGLPPILIEDLITTQADGGCRDPGDGSPLVIDLENDGFSFGPKGFGTMFDIKSEGIEKYYQWVKFDTNDAFLVLDLNDNGEIDGGEELFGEGTYILNTTQKASNGFEALAQYDSLENGGNGDGKISSSDAIWSALQVWRDKNADGISARDELLKLSDVQIQTISLGYVTNHIKDHADNTLLYWSWVETSSGQRREIVDVYFKEI